MTFAARYRAVKSLWNEEWWCIAFGGPVGNFLNALIADVPWITPNRLTILGFLCSLCAAPLILLGTPATDIAAIVLLQCHTVLDCMDGALARYRKATSVTGAFLDKVTDMIGLLVIMSTLGWRVFHETGDEIAMLVAVLIAASIMLRGYVFWVVANLERERAVAKPSVGDRRRDLSDLRFRERAALYLRSMWKIVEFQELDLYFWLSVGLAVGHVHEMIYFLATATGFWLLAILAWRWWTVVKLERLRRIA
jgi:phosphatidylglycerophosphate synthase